MTLQWCDDAASYVKELTNDGVPSVDYVLFALENPKSAHPKMELFSMGKGGRAKVEELLLPETHQVITGAFLASAIDESGSVVSVRRKFIHVIWVGTRVGIMVKGKVNTSLTQPFKDPFPGCAMYLQFSDGDVDDLQAAGLEKTLLAAGGAHKPTRYSFTNRSVMGSLNMDDSSFNQSGQRAEEERRRAEAEARRKAAAEEARRKAAEAEKQRLAEEEAKRVAQEETKRQADAARREKEEERLQKLNAQEAERKAREEAARRKAEEEEQKAAAERKAKDEERLKKVNAQEAERKAKEEAARRKAYEEEQRAAAMTPKAALQANDKSLIMLISSMSGNMTTSTNQARATSMLAGLEVKPEVVDGAEPTNKDMRNELFAISNLRGKYPQFFLRQKDGSIKFFADMDTFDYYNDTGTLAQQLGMSATPKNNTSSAGNNNMKDPPQVVSTLNGHKLLLLISSMSGSTEVSANQTRVQGILNGLHLSKEEVEVMDGCEPSIRDRRNELFGISGIRAKYPQLFLVHRESGDTKFVGNFDDVSYLHDTNTFNQAVGLVTKSAETKTVEETTTPAVVVAETVEQPTTPVPPTVESTNTDGEPKTTTDATVEEPDAGNKGQDSMEKLETPEELEQQPHLESDEGPSTVSAPEPATTEEVPPLLSSEGDEDPLTAASQPEPSSQQSEQASPPEEEEAPLPSPPVEETAPIVEEAPANEMKTSPPEAPPQQPQEEKEAQPPVEATEAPNDPSAKEEISQECEPDDTPPQPRTKPRKPWSDGVDNGDGGDAVEDTSSAKPEETADEMQPPDEDAGAVVDDKAAESQSPEEEQAPKAAEEGGVAASSEPQEGDDGEGPVDPSGADKDETPGSPTAEENESAEAPSQGATEASEAVDQSADDASPKLEEPNEDATETVEQEDGSPDIVASESSVVDEAELPPLVESNSQLDEPDKEAVQNDPVTPAE